MIKAVILDFDDTLCLTQKQSFARINEVLAKMGRPPMEERVHIETWGMILSDSMQLRSPGIDYDDFKKLFDETRLEYIKAGQMDQIPQENFDTLEKIIEQGQIVAMVTSRTFNEVKHLLDEQHPLSPLISDFYHKDNSKYHKPDPRVFDEFLNKHSLKPSECIYVGDSLSDAEATVAAGMHFIASLESGLKNKEDFKKHGTKYFINSFPDLIEAIAKLDSK